MSHNSVLAGVISSQRGGGVGGGGGVPVVQGSGLRLVRDKDTSIVLELTTPGSGSNRILLGKLGPDLPDPPQTGVVYTPSLVFGSGDEINTGTFVLATGNVSNWEVTGLPSDTEVTFVSYEFNSSGSQYLVSVGDNNLTTRTAVIYDDVFATGSGDPPGKTDLETNSKFYYDFSLLTGSDGSTIVGGNPGLNDEGPGTNTLSPLNSPQVRDISIGGGTTKTLRSFGTACVDTGVSGNSFFQSDFEIYLYFQTEDGIPPSNINFCGTTATNGLSIFSIVIDSDGQLLIRYRTPGQDSRWDSTSALLADGVNTEHILRIKYDFTGNTHGVWLDGSPVSGSFISGSISALDPSTFNSNVNFKIGSHDFFGIQNNATVTSIIRMACTGLKSDQEAADIEAYLTFQASSGSTLQDYTIQEVAGFDQEVIGNELILSGDPLGYRDWVSHEFVLPANLEHFEVEVGLRINEAPDTTSAGIGLGIRNDLATEANRASVMEFVTETDSNSFGQVQLYAGNGTVSETAFSFRSQSSTVLAPALNNEYVLTLTREPLTNDAFYTGSIVGVSEGQKITTAYTEIGRPSSEFFGDTMRTWIHQNAGGHAITYFLIRRLGTEVTTPPPPEEFDIYVDIAGNDTTGDGSIGAPLRTVAAGFSAIAALGGSNRSMSISAGTFTETTYLNPPNNLGIMSGAGKDVTIIRGAPNLYTAETVSGRSSQNNFLFNLTTSTATDVTGMEFRNFTIDGNKNDGGYTNSMRGGFAIRNKNGIVIDNVGIRYFNTCGIRIWDTETLTVKNTYLKECSDGTTQGTPYYHVEFGSGSTGGVGGATLLYSSQTPPVDGDYNVLFENVLIDSDVTGEGQGYGFLGGSGVNRYIQNVHFKNCSTFTDSDGDINGFGHNFNVEWLDMKTGNILWENCFFNSNLSFGTRGVAAQPGWMRFYNCHFDRAASSTAISVEMQVSKIEFDHCLFTNVRSGGLISTNDQDNYDNTNPEFEENHGDWWVHHSIFQIYNTGFGTGIIGGTNWDIKGVVIENNTFEFINTSGQLWYGIIVDNDAGSALTGLVMQNNAYVGQPPASSALIDPTGTITSGIARYNKSTHLNVTASRTGVTVSNSQIHGAGNSLGLGLGTRPTTWQEAFVTSQYYVPQTSLSSPLIDAGFGGVTIGALEEN